jgi:acyl carrier protein
MNKESIFRTVQDIFRDVFDDEELVISSSTCSEEIEEWDSMNHITLVLSIEKTLNIRFMTGEIQSLKNVGEMVDLLAEKITSRLSS